jgi:hypothetical protein
LVGDFRVSIGIDFYAKIGYPFILKADETISSFGLDLFWVGGLLFRRARY